ncbi:MAG: hypothetical protein AAGB19_23455, partial [Cyanobacteria bacterium P01_F01_bin.3]
MIWTLRYALSIKTQNPKLLWAALFVSAVSMLPGCRLEIVVPKGGEVKTAGNTYQCGEIDTCEIDITSSDFAETFVAVPNAGYQFKGWSSRGRSFCPAQEVDCYLSTLGFDAFPALAAILDSDQAFYLQPMFVSNTIRTPPQGFKPECFDRANPPTTPRGGFVYARGSGSSFYVSLESGQESYRSAVRLRRYTEGRYASFDPDADFQTPNGRVIDLMTGRTME